jgi:hypothetical protein
MERHRRAKEYTHGDHRQTQQGDQCCSCRSQELAAKRLELLRELVPGAVRVAALVNPANPNAETILRDVQAAARAMGLQIQVRNAGTIDEIDTGFATFARARPDALVVAPDPLFLARRVQLVLLAASNKIPRPMACATMSRPAGWQATEQALRMRPAKSASIPAASLRARSRIPHRPSADPGGLNPYDRFYKNHGCFFFITAASSSLLSALRAISYFNGGKSAKYSGWAFSTSAMKEGRN